MNDGWLSEESMKVEVRVRGLLARPPLDEGRIRFLLLILLWNLTATVAFERVLPRISNLLLRFRQRRLDPYTPILYCRQHSRTNNLVPWCHCQHTSHPHR